MRHRTASKLIGIALFLLIGNAFAESVDNPPTIETSKTFGAYEVLYTVIPSTTLSPEMAAEYRIVRAGDQALMNISVRKHLADGSDVAQAAQLTGTYSDLIQTKKLEFREVAESGAIYYLAQLRFTDHETLRFDIKVNPQFHEGDTAPIGAPFAISFTRKFYVEH